MGYTVDVIHGSGKTPYVSIELLNWIKLTELKWTEMNWTELQWSSFHAHSIE